MSFEKHGGHTISSCGIGSLHTILMLNCFVIYVDMRARSIADFFQGARRLLPECVHLPSRAHARLRVHVLSGKSHAPGVVLHHQFRCEVSSVGTAVHDVDHGWPGSSSRSSYWPHRGSYVRLPDAHLAHFRWRHKLHNHACNCEAMVWWRCWYAAGQTLWYGSAGTINRRCTLYRSYHGREHQSMGSWSPFRRVILLRTYHI